MSNPTILVLAASRYQIPVIEKAREMGLRVITLDNRPSNPGHRLADASYFVDTTNRDEVLRVAKEENIEGVLAACTDVAVPTAAYVAASLGLPGPSLEGCSVLCNKKAFREYQEKKGYPCPAWFSADTFAGEIGDGSKQWILKPQFSSGSKGVRIAKTKKEFNEALGLACSVDPGNKAIAEEFIEGRQGTCEGLFLNGKIGRFWVTERMTAAKPYVATAGHRIPHLLRQDEVDELKRQVETILRDLGFINTLFDADFVVGDRVVLLEMTPRLGGNSLASFLELSAGVDLPRCALEVALGRRVTVPGLEKARCASVIILGVESSGRLSFRPGSVQALQKKYWVHGLKLDWDEGMPVGVFSDGGNRVGEVMLSASGRGELLEREQMLYEALDLKALPDSELENGLKNV